jgi:methyl-accepting chemotaxis protein
MSNENGSIIPNGEHTSSGRHSRPVHGERSSQREASEISLEVTRQILDGAPVNVMFADLDGTITYVNQACLGTLRELQDHLPVRADQIVGRGFDVFFKSSSQQRRLISNPRNLPHESVIQLGPEKLKLLVTAVLDARGSHVGTMATWEMVTEKVALDEQNAAYAAQAAAIDR